MSNAISIASDGIIYVGEATGQRVREIRDGVVRTLCQCQGRVQGLFLDERNGLLYATVLHRIITVIVPTLAQRQQVRFAPTLRLRSLAQRGRAQMTLAAADESALESRARRALGVFVRCPVELAALVLTFAYN